MSIETIKEALTSALNQQYKTRKINPESAISAAYEIVQDMRSDIGRALNALSIIDHERIHSEARAERDELKKRIAELEMALENLQFAESRYRYQHDALGDGDIKTGMAWDSMKKRGDEARAALAEKGE